MSFRKEFSESPLPRLIYSLLIIYTKQYLSHQQLPAKYNTNKSTHPPVGEKAFTDWAQQLTGR